MDPPSKRQRTAAETLEGNDGAAAAEAEKGAEEEEESGGEGELDLAIDEEGRVALTGETAPDYRFRSFTSFVAADDAMIGALVRDCEAAFTAGAAESSGRYSRGDTFWIGADEAPATRLEQLAQAVFKLHAGSVECDRSKSGAEWWPLVLAADDDVGWHWDRDYALEADAGIRLHPHVASVTYLSSVGAPTAVMELAEAEGPGEGKPAAARVAHLSLPSPGKHISFDGRWLHAAPADLGVAVVPEGVASKAGGRRVTFLVNVWLNFKPLSAMRFPNPGALSPASGEICSLRPLEATPSRVVCSNEGCTSFSWSLRAGDDSADEDEDEEEEEEEESEEEEENGEEGEQLKRKRAKEQQSAGRQRRVRLSLPLAQLRTALAAGSSLTLELPQGAAMVEVPEA